MSRFDRYLLRQVVFATVSAVGVLTVVMVLGNLFKEIEELLVQNGAPLAILGKLILLILPYSLVFTIPWGFLAGVILVFGRLSADQEIVSIRGEAGVCTGLRYRFCCLLSPFQPFVCM